MPAFAHATASSRARNFRPNSIAEGWRRRVMVAVLAALFMTIVFSQQAMAQTPVLSINDVTRTEGSLFFFTVTLSSPAGPGGVSLDIGTADGTAIGNDEDYTSRSVSGAIIPEGDDSGLFSVSTKYDSLSEASETFFVNVFNITGATAGDTQGTGTILDDDPLPMIMIDDVSVLEGDIGLTEAIFAISLSEASGQSVDVSVAVVGGTATTGSDYLNPTITGPFVFAPGQTTRQIIIPVLGDVTPEDDETFSVILSNPTNATIAKGTGTATIIDDDSLTAINTITPITGPTTGGTNVVITGVGMAGATAVNFGGTAAASFVVDSSTQITAVTPAHAPGAVDVEVRTIGPSSTMVDGFTFIASAPTIAGVAPATGPTAGGTSVVITGTDLTGATAVSFGGTAAASFVVDSSTQITAVTQAHAAGAVDVVVTTPEGNDTLLDGFTFAEPARPDPSLDPDVVGLIGAQAGAASRFAQTQITNFSRRLEQLHDEGERRANSMAVDFSVEQPAGNAYAPREDGPDDPALDAIGQAAPDPQSAPVEALFGDVAFWSGGFVNFGTNDDGAIELDHSLAGVSAGVDYRFTPELTAGLGLGYGRDVTDIGTNGTGSRGDAFSIAAYGSYRPQPGLFIDGLAGYSAMDFSSRRFVAATGDIAAGIRSGDQIFAALSAGYEHRAGALLVSPYGRLSGSHSTLDAFTETGAGIWNLAYGEQTIDTLSGTLGLRLEYAVPTEWGVLTPRARIEYTHDFEGSSRANLGYADLGTLPYTVDADGFSRDHLAVGLGVDAQIGAGWTLGLDYSTALGTDGGSRDHSFAGKLGIRF